MPGPPGTYGSILLPPPPPSKKLKQKSYCYMYCIMLLALGCDGVKGRDGSEGCRARQEPTAVYSSPPPPPPSKKLKQKSYCHMYCIMLLALGCDGVKGRDGSEGCQGPPGTAGTYGSILLPPPPPSKKLKQKSYCYMYCIMLFVLGCDGVKGRDGSEGCQGPPGTAGTYGSILWTVLDKDDQIVSQVGHRYDVEVTHFEVEQKFVIEYCITG